MKSTSNFDQILVGILQSLGLVVRRTGFAINEGG
jgi:hypothetical protein